MIKTNGKHIGINANPETNYDFVLSNIRPPFRKLLRGLDLYNYVMSLPDTDFKGELINHSGTVTGYYYKRSFQDKYPNNLHYCTATNSYIDAALYSFVNRATGFNTLYNYRKTSTKKFYRIICIDLSKAQGYKYVCIFSKYRLNPLKIYEDTLQLSHSLYYGYTYKPNNNMGYMFVKSYEIKRYDHIMFLTQSDYEYEIYVIATNNDIGILKAYNTDVDINTYETVGNKVLDVDKFFITV